MCLDWLGLVEGKIVYAHVVAVVAQSSVTLCTARTGFSVKLIFISHASHNAVLVGTKQKELLSSFV